jgi:BirA family biotin operon repressor/biotin-[acetyl-CoA-carboxylase] ligase
MIDAGQLRAATFVRHVEAHETLGSTNNRAAELARRADIELPALVVARVQSAGKGRGLNTWWSADGALTFSVLIDPATTGVLRANWPQLSLATAVAVCDAIVDQLPPSDQRAARGGSVGIKWPNDVLLDGGKVCGILIESPGGAAPANSRLIIGIGVNVNNSWRNAPHDAGSGGTALCDVTCQQHNLQTVLNRILIALATRIAQLRDHDAQLVKSWQQLDRLSGQRVLVNSNGQCIEGECREISPHGALVVDTVFGQLSLYSGSVRVV